MIRALCFASCVLLAGCGSTPPSAQERAPEDGYPIRLVRGSRVGDRYRIDAMGDRVNRMRMTIGDAPPSEENEILHLELSGTVTVREVNANGDEIVQEIEIEQCTGRDAAGDRIIAQPGSTLRVQVSEDEEVQGTITLDGGQLSEEDVELLSIVISRRIGAVRDDQIFGSESSRALGERWPINGALAAQSLDKLEGMDASRAVLTGEMSVRGIEHVRGVECLHVGGTLEANGFGLEVTPDSVTEESSMTAEMSTLLPLDVRVPRLLDHQRMRMRVRVRFTTDDGRPATIEMDSATEQRVDYRR
jgi:hypothetical protein